MPAPKVQMKSVEKNVTARLVVALRIQRESIPTCFFCAARFVHAFRVYEKAATFFLLCFWCLRLSFTRSAFLFGASCCVRAIAPATVTSLSQRIRDRKQVERIGLHKQPFYFSGSKCCVCL